MGGAVDFASDLADTILDAAKVVVKAVVKIVEVVIDVLASLLGFNNEKQTIEYFAVENIPLFEDLKKRDPFKEAVLSAIIKDEDLPTEILYNTVFNSLKANVGKFISHIEQEKYFDGFPSIVSRITYIDYEEIDATLTSLTGVPCTPESSRLGSLSTTAWIQYWLQENRDYDVGENKIQGEYSYTSTPLLQEVIISYPDSNEILIEINENIKTTSLLNIEHPDEHNILLELSDSVATEDDVLADTRWSIDFSTVEYDYVNEEYEVEGYNDTGATTLFIIPKKPVNMHYTVYYYKDSNPNRIYIFIYLVGSGTYPALDDPQDPINEDPIDYKVFPAIPLRVSNTNFTDFTETKKDSIKNTLKILNLDGEQILDSILNEPGADPGVIDNIFVNFGVRMWDTSQEGMEYLYKMFQNLYATQSVTKGSYESTPVNDEKPYNRIEVSTSDYDYILQFSYITNKFTPLSEIDADTSSIENGIYYSDMSRFNSNNKLAYNYFVSSGKGTYNVGYKASTLEEVDLFMEGNGIINPGDTSEEATNWLQVTERLSHTRELREANGKLSKDTFLDPSLIYENKEGILTKVESAEEETTRGQSITYYECTPEGLNAYTVNAPLAVLKVIDGATGVFKFVRFNLANKKDLIVPLIYAFIDSISVSALSKLFITGAHVSIYLAKYEVIKQRKFNLLKLITLVLIIVVAWRFAPQIAAALSSSAAPAAGTPGIVTYTAEGITHVTKATAAANTTGGMVFTEVATGATITSGTFTSVSSLGITTAKVFTATSIASSVVWIPTILQIGAQFAIGFLLKTAVTNVAKNNRELALVLAVAATLAIGVHSYKSGASSITTTGKTFATGSDLISTVNTVYAENELKEINKSWNEYLKEYTDKMNVLADIQKDMLKTPNGKAMNLINLNTRVLTNNVMSPEVYHAYYDNMVELNFIHLDKENMFNMLSPNNVLI